MLSFFIELTQSHRKSRAQICHVFFHLSDDIFDVEGTFSSVVVHDVVAVVVTVVTVVAVVNVVTSVATFAVVTPVTIDAVAIIVAAAVFIGVAAVAIAAVVIGVAANAAAILASSIVVYRHHIADSVSGESLNNKVSKLYKLLPVDGRP